VPKKTAGKKSATKKAAATKRAISQEESSDVNQQILENVEHLQLSLTKLKEDLEVALHIPLKGPVGRKPRADEE